jgi:hypothetical protein
VEEKGQPRINQSYLQWLGQSFFNLSIIFVKKLNKTLKNGIVTTSNQNVFMSCKHTPQTHKRKYLKKG